MVEGHSANGYLNGEATFDLSTEGEGDKLKTVVAYKGVAIIGGTLASVGARLLSPIAKLLIGNFFKNMEKQIPEVEAAYQQQSQ
jgi:carbon monoxide dehydrogenase subunit G